MQLIIENTARKNTAASDSMFSDPAGKVSTNKAQKKTADPAEQMRVLSQEFAGEVHVFFGQDSGTRDDCSSISNSSDPKCLFSGVVICLSRQFGSTVLGLSIFLSLVSNIYFFSPKSLSVDANEIS